MLTRASSRISDGRAFSIQWFMVSAATTLGLCHLRENAASASSGEMLAEEQIVGAALVGQQLGSEVRRTR